MGIPAFGSRDWAGRKKEHSPHQKAHICIHREVLTVHRDVSYSPENSNLCRNPTGEEEPRRIFSIAARAIGGCRSRLEKSPKPLIEPLSGRFVRRSCRSESKAAGAVKLFGFQTYCPRRSLNLFIREGDRGSC
ncbi:hypothetical protein LIER_00730 [Lithospermum erythrorhizon]|uniref:Uncharacterized protein n=1 Tax=Lithospermum erythrorhizon TaxID=34254 RepID=A0AAV3NJH8_LITER